MTTWIERYPPPHAGPDREHAEPNPEHAGPNPEHAGAPDGVVRVAVKDAIDVAGSLTTAGCVAVRDRARPAAADATCLAGVRAAGAWIAGKTSLTELCVSPVGLNDEFGSPVNPLAPQLIPGGSSSGSAVAVATGEADVAFGTDTGGSVRIPAACCGVVGLKTTWGRIPTAGVWPLATSLDTVGPLARDVAGASTGMRLLEPGWTAASRPATVVGRLRIGGAGAGAGGAGAGGAGGYTDPAVEDAVDAALAAAGLTVHPVRLPRWFDSVDPFVTIVLGELWRAHHSLLDADGVGPFCNDGLRKGRTVTDGRLAAALSARAAWREQVCALFREVELLALPTLVGPPPELTGFAGYPLTALTAPFNLAGVPALALPVPPAGPPAARLPLPLPAAVPPSLQLVGPPGGEDLLCTTGLLIEAAVAWPADPGRTA